MKHSLSAALILLGVFACGPQKAQTSDPDSVVSTRNKWSNPEAIPVCLINRNEISDELFNDVKSHVTNDYASKAGIVFTGWGACQSSDFNAKVIRVTFSRVHNWAGRKISAGGGLSMVGSSSSSCGTGCRGGTMRLDVSQNGQYPAEGTWARTFAVTQTRATAVHEFGHAMGLLHEHERTDAPGCGDYDDEVRNSDRNVYVGSFDANSIMNYCHNSSLTNLSPGDVNGLKYLYPALGSSNNGAKPLPTPTPTPTPDQVKAFGPFDHNVSLILTTLPNTEGRYVNFTVAVDVEDHPSCEYDHVIVEDAAGWKSRSFCGRTTWKLSNLVAPVKVIFNSDPAVASKSVKISKIAYSGNGSAGEPSEAASPTVDAEAAE
ncbi:MAG: hypothetical protein M3Q07_18080 [Pseudobdellovibrionaceae bacterium]|nr:hypothetical protein [Pseudobdellovibrionaceae bacterium]